MHRTKVLVFTPQYAPDFGPSAPIFTWLCEDLVQKGCDVSVITGFPHSAGTEKWFQPSKKLVEEDRLNGVRILRTYVYTVPKTSLRKRLLYHGSYNLLSTLMYSYDWGSSTATGW